MIILAYPAHLPLWISEQATEEARKQLHAEGLRAPHLSALQARAFDIADAIFEAIHLPNTSFH